MSLNSIDLVTYFQSQINNIRTNPQHYIQSLQSRKFVNDLQFIHSVVPNVHYKTSQGMQAVKQAIIYLQNKKPIKQLILSQELCQVAYQVGIGMSKQHTIDNVGQYVDKIDKQLQKLGLVQTGQTQIIIQYGFREDPEIIPSIIVDDGDINRRNRNLLMNQNMKFIGISVHQHQQFDYMLLILLNGHVKSKAGCSCSIF